MKMDSVAAVVMSIIIVTATVSPISSNHSLAATQRTLSATKPDLSVTAPITKVGQPDYKIGAQDMLVVDVFQIPDLSRTVQVDSSGHILLPLIGQVMASGRTAEQLSAEIMNDLGQKYLKDPQVAVTVKDSLSQKVTVDGAVMQPGIYPIVGNTTLLQAVALAKGPDSHVANLSRVAIFRETGRQRTAAVFNLEDIRDGKTVDPPVFADDVIVVDTSGTKNFLHNIVGDMAPLFSILHPF